MSRRYLLRVLRQPHTGEVPSQAPGALSRCPSALELTVWSRTCQQAAKALCLRGGRPRSEAARGSQRVDLRKIPGLSPFVLLSPIGVVARVAGSRSVRQTREVLIRLQQVTMKRG